MKLSPLISTFSRRVPIWLAWLVGTAVWIFAALAATMYFWVLPNIADHRDTLADLLSRALGQRVTL